eukprot:326774-Chlamydomonas_euryale.AAC.2
MAMHGETAYGRKKCGNTGSGSPPLPVPPLFLQQQPRALPDCTAAHNRTCSVYRSACSSPAGYRASSVLRISSSKPSASARCSAHSARATWRSSSRNADTRARGSAGGSDGRQADAARANARRQVDRSRATGDWAKGSAAREGGSGLVPGASSPPSRGVCVCRLWGPAASAERPEAPPGRPDALLMRPDALLMRADASTVRP